jgi:hypothetical protein
MADKDMPNRASNMVKAEGDRWSSDSGTVERRDRERTDSGADIEDIVDRSGAHAATPRRYEQPDYRGGN